MLAIDSGLRDAPEDLGQPLTSSVLVAVGQPGMGGQSWKKKIKLLNSLGKCFFLNAAWTEELS